MEGMIYCVFHPADFDIYDLLCIPSSRIQTSVIPTTIWDAAVVDSGTRPVNFPWFSSLPIKPTANIFYIWSKSKKGEKKIDFSFYSSAQVIIIDACKLALCWWSLNHGVQGWKHYVHRIPGFFRGQCSVLRQLLSVWISENLARRHDFHAI